MQDVGKDSFVRSMEIRRDDVYSRIMQEMSTMENFISRKMNVVYQRNCYRKYTSKQHCNVFKTDQINFTSTEEVSTTSQTSVVTPSQYEPIKWDFCFICQNKTFKKDFKVHNIASGERVNTLMESALRQNDDRLVRVLNCDDFLLKGVYHNVCMTKYLLNSSPKNQQKQDSDLSSNEIAFQNLIHEINDDLVVHRKGFTKHIYPQKQVPAHLPSYKTSQLNIMLVL